jgi:hypothetical protein
MALPSTLALATTFTAICWRRSCGDVNIAHIDRDQVSGLDLSRRDKVEFRVSQFYRHWNISHFATLHSSEPDLLPFPAARRGVWRTIKNTDRSKKRDNHLFAANAPALVFGCWRHMAIGTQLLIGGQRPWAFPPHTSRTAAQAKSVPLQSIIQDEDRQADGHRPHLMIPHDGQVLLLLDCDVNHSGALRATLQFDYPAPHSGTGCPLRRWHITAQSPQLKTATPQRGGHHRLPTIKPMR